MRITWTLSTYIMALSISKIDASYPDSFITDESPQSQAPPAWLLNMLKSWPAWCVLWFCRLKKDFYKRLATNTLDLKWIVLWKNRLYLNYIVPWSIHCRGTCIGKFHRFCIGMQQNLQSRPTHREQCCHTDALKSKWKISLMLQKYP